MKFIKALTLSLGELNSPAVTQYQLGLLIHKLYQGKTYNNEPLNISKAYAERQDYIKHLNHLIDEGILDQRAGYPSGMFSLLGLAMPDPEDLVCRLDPFCYLSHLSAMDHHGLTDRIPSKLFISTPAPTEWKLFAQQKMEKDLGESFSIYTDNNLPRLTRLKFDRLGKTEIHSVHSKHLGAYKNTKGRPLRVATIGRTFLDMLRKPDLCGGINHVLQTYDNYAERYLRLITDEIDQHGNKMEKVRAGYILDERMRLSSNTVEKWKQFAQRGGSRKLDASAEYAPEWSDNWCLSINVYE